MAIPFTYQSSEHACGYAVAKMLLAFYAHDKSYLSLPEPSSETAPSLSEVIDYAGRFGLTLVAKKAEGRALFSVKNEELPLALALQEGESLHLVILEKAGKRTARVLDPAEGRIEASKKDLATLFSGYYLEPEAASRPGPCPRAKEAENSFSLLGAIGGTLVSLGALFGALMEGLYAYIGFAMLAIGAISLGIAAKRGDASFDAAHLCPYFRGCRSAAKVRVYAATRAEIVMGEARGIALLFLALGAPLFALGLEKGGPFLLASFLGTLCLFGAKPLLRGLSYGETAALSRFLLAQDEDELKKRWQKAQKRGGRAFWGNFLFALLLSFALSVSALAVSAFLRREAPGASFCLKAFLAELLSLLFAERFAEERERAEKAAVSVQAGFGA